MSTLAVNTITNAAGANTAQINGMTPTADSLQGFRNRIINGDMRIDQRNAGASVVVANATDAYAVDRWRFYEDSDGVITIQQSAVVPTGFNNSILVTVTTPDASLAAGQFALFEQRVEGFNSSDLGWGTASAQSVTLSFWVRSSVTGTFGGAFGNSAFNRSYPFTYTINSANTWEQKTLTVPGDTSGTWVTNNGIGIRVQFGLGVGSSLSGTAGAWTASGLLSATGATNLLATSGATFYITGVQLEAGSVATPFERRPYGTELSLCQRYLYTIGGAFNGSVAFQMYGNGLATTTTNAGIFIWNPVTMRSAPSLSVVNAANFSVSTINSAFAATTASLEVASQTNSTVLFTIASASLTAGQGVRVNQNSTSATQLLFVSEL